MSILSKVKTEGPYHQVGIADMVLDDASSQDNDSSLLGKDSLVVHAANVRHNVDDQTGVLVRVEVDHVAQGSIGQSWAEYWDVVL